MSEKENNNINANSEEIKNETKSTVNEVRETMKNVNIKDDAKVTTGFVTSMLKDPLSELKKIANDSKNSNFKNAIILMIVWTLVVLLKSIFTNHWKFQYLGSNVLSVIKTIVAPIAGILVLSAIIYFMQKDKNENGKKSLTTIITTLTTAAIPLILALIISLLTIFSYSITRITSPLITFATIITIIYTYFGAKSLLSDEENSKFVKKFMIIEGIYYVAYFIISFLEIYIPMI